MNVLIKGKFKKIIYRNENFNVVIFNIFSNQENQKKELEIPNEQNNINIITRNINFELSMDYEIEIKKIKNKKSKYLFSYYLENKKIINLDTKENLIKYLSSSLFKGINKKTANLIVDNINFEFVDNIKKYENDLINLIGKKKYTIIKDVLENENEYNQFYKIFIENNFDISILNHINKVSKNIKTYLEENIWNIIFEKININFFELNKIASFFYKNYDQNIYFKYLILFEILKIENNGSTINEIKSIYKNVIQYVFLNVNDFKKYIKNLYEEKLIIIDENKYCVSSMYIYNKELYICNRIKKLINKNNLKTSNKEMIFFENIDNNQKEAIINSIKKSFYIITGGPGTGKTSLIKNIIENLINDFKRNDIITLAPTGRAATQISKKANFNAKTFHSFLKWNEDRKFEINEKNPSNIKIAIIDEFSMVDINLFFDFLKGCPFLEKIIIVGDKDQLPSIGPGNLLNDFIIHNNENVSFLKKIYRQKEGSLIAKNAQKINKGKKLKYDNEESIFYDLNEINQDIKEKISLLLNEFLRYDNNLKNFQILCTMYDGNNGINNINLYIQKLMNYKKDILFKINDVDYYLGDKIIQLENQNEKNINNGEIGWIKGVSFNDEKEIKTIKVFFSKEKIIEYTKNEFKNNVNLAYAISVHKFQGSEIDNVVLIFPKEHEKMFSKKIFYTAYTRAKKQIIIFSENELIEKMLNDKDFERKTNILKIMKMNI